MDDEEIEVRYWMGWDMVYTAWIETFTNKFNDRSLGVYYWLIPIRSGYVGIVEDNPDAKATLVRKSSLESTLQSFLAVLAGRLTTPNKDQEIPF